MTTTVGLVAPGDMGAVVARAVVGPAVRVLWASGGRSAATRARAQDAGIEDVGALVDLVAASDVVLSVCPPHAAIEVATEVAELGFPGRYVDANAVAPGTARTIQDLVVPAGADYVDGGIIGPPPVRSGTTRLYLAGQHAAGIAELFAGGPLEAIVLDGDVPAASALKMAFAGWTKGSAALLLAMRALAAAEGVEDDLVAEWERSLPDLIARSGRAAASGAAKGWRWIGEMEEIAASQAAVGMPDGFHLAAAELYRRMAHLRHADAPTLQEAIDALRGTT